jgi:uncharacterized protein
MDYQFIDATLAKIDADLSAAEIHGLASGLLCMDNQVQPAVWLQELNVAQNAIAAEDEALLLDLFNQCATLLISQSFHFELFLPDDETALSTRLEGLRRWCQGYLYGIGAATRQTEWPEDMREIIRDLTELTKLEIDSDESNEAENDYVEIAEYVKTGVIYINAEMNPDPGGTVH